MNTEYALPTVQALATTLMPPIAANAVVPVAGPAVSHERAVLLAERLRRDIDAVSSVKGPLFAKKLSAKWATRYNNDWQTPLATGVAVIAGFVGAMAALDGVGTPTYVCAALAGLAVVGGVFSTLRTRHLFDASNKHAQVELDSDDLQQMLGTFAAASPQEKAILTPVVGAALSQVESSLSAKAALVRDQMLAELPPLHPQDARTSAVAAVIDDLLHDGWLGEKQIQALTTTVNAAEGAERKEIAATLEAKLFDAEQCRFRGTTEAVRVLYGLIHAAKGGNAFTGTFKDKWPELPE